MAIILSNPELPSVKIRISGDKCKIPMLCPNPCYRLCPQGVFIVAINPQKQEKWKNIDVNTPGDFMMIAPMISKCTGCMKCVKNCPNGAIKIKYKPPKQKPELETSN